MKKTILIAIGLCYVLLVNAQSVQEPVNTKISDPPYVMGDYLISPDSRTIGVYEMIGGIFWDGHAYPPNDKYNYCFTTLYVLGNQIFFKEDYEEVCGFDPNRVSLPIFKLDTVIPRNLNCAKNPELIKEAPDLSKYLDEGDLRRKNSCAFDSLRLIYSDPNGQKAICRDNKALYSFSPHYSLIVEKIDISKYKCINNFVYQDTLGVLYVLPYLTSSKLELQEVKGLPNIDLPSLKHVTGNYFTDKNGLYYLGNNERDVLRDVWYTIERDSVSVKLEDSKGEVVEPIVTKNYFIYAQGVYAISTRPEIAKLNLDADKITEHLLGAYVQKYVITDGNNIYYTCNAFSHNRKKYYTASPHFAREIKQDLKNGFYWKDIDKWKVINFSGENYVKGSNNSLYLPSSKKPFSGRVSWQTLVHTPKGFYLFGTGNPSRVNKVYVYNYDTKKHEELDINEYLSIREGFYVYKNRLYAHNLPVKEYFDCSKLRFIKLQNSNTNYITDGKRLLYVGQTGGYATVKDDNGETVTTFARHESLIRDDIDIPNLKAISEDMLFDGKHIIKRDGGEIVVIPIFDLGFDVEISVP